MEGVLGGVSGLLLLIVIVLLFVVMGTNRRLNEISDKLNIFNENMLTCQDRTLTVQKDILTCLQKTPESSSTGVDKDIPVKE